MWKIKLLFIFFLILYLIVIAKLFLIQVFNIYRKDNFLYLQSKKLMPERGKIYDRQNNPLVLNQINYLMYLEPKKIENKDIIFKKLEAILKIDKASLEAKFDREKYWIPVADRLDKETKSEIEKLKIKGIGFEEKMRRYYPEASLSAHLLGFVGKNKDGEDIGYFGVEGFYNKELTGLPGFIQSEKDILGRPIMIGLQEKVEPENGRDLILTVDKTIQEIAKKKLAEGLKNYKAKSGCVIVADPSTMAILALVCLPDYDPDNYYLFSENYFKNPAISDLFEPGSIFKPLIMAAALQENKIKPDDFYNEQGPINIGEYQIRTWDNKYEGKISMTRILERSSNVGMVFIGEKLGKKNLLKYLNKFGFNELTGIDLQGEVSGFLKPVDQWYPIDYATVTFGQGIAVTPIQMITAFASIINGGNLMRPYVVSTIVSSDKKNVIKPKKIREIINEKNSLIIRKMLTSAVENGEVSWARPKGYKIGGKTGTAQIPIKGRYDPSKTIASFIGFIPADQPKIIVLVTLKEPGTSPWGSETAAPLFFEIIKELILYYNLVPE